MSCSDKGLPNAACADAFEVSACSFKPRPLHGIAFVFLSLTYFHSMVPRTKEASTCWRSIRKSQSAPLNISLYKGEGLGGDQIANNPPPIPPLEDRGEQKNELEVSNHNTSSIAAQQTLQAGRGHAALPAIDTASNCIQCPLFSVRLPKGRLSTICVAPTTPLACRLINAGLGAPFSIIFNKVK